MSAPLIVAVSPGKLRKVIGRPGLPELVGVTVSRYVPARSQQVSPAWSKEAAFPTVAKGEFIVPFDESLPEGET